jgi:hypothetical protein
MHHPNRRTATVRWLVASCALCAALTSPGSAAEASPLGPFSVGASGGEANGRVDCVQAYPCGHNAGFGKIMVSASISSTIEVQASYFRVGDLQGGDTTPLGTRFGGIFKLSGIGLTAGYRWDFAPDWDLTARGGIAGVRARFAYAAPFSGEPSRTTVQPLGGLDLDYAITSALRVGLDYQATRLKAHATRGALQTIGVGVQFSF